MKERKTIRYEDTDAFRAWLKQRGIVWERLSHDEQQRLLAEEMRDGLSNASAVPKQDRAV